MNHTLTLAARLEAMSKTEAAIKSHPMCLRFFEQRHHYLVILPSNNLGLDAVRVEKNNKKLNALTQTLNKLEDLWQQDNAWWLGEKSA